MTGVQQNEFQQSLREHLVRSVHYPRSVDFFVSECEAFFATQENFIKALHPTEVLPLCILYDLILLIIHHLYRMHW